MRYLRRLSGFPTHPADPPIYGSVSGSEVLKISTAFSKLPGCLANATYGTGPPYGANASCVTDKRTDLRPWET